MYLTKKTSNKYTYISLIKIMGLIVGFNIAACNCRQAEAGIDTNQAGSLTMTISDTKLMGSSQTTEVFFNLSDNTKEALLENFKLQTSVLKEKGGTGSKIKYNTYVDGKPAPKKDTFVDKKLIHFTKDEKLVPGDAPLKVGFKIKPGEGVTNLVVKFTLLDAANQPIGNSIKVTWKEEKQPIKLALERMSPEHIQGANKAIQLKISNLGTQQPEANQLKLKAIRTTGTSAVINGAILTTNTNEYEIALGKLIDNKSTIQGLNIIPNEDTKAEYTLQLLYKGELIGNEIKASWEKGIELTLSGIEHDKATQSIIYTVANTGSIVASNLKIQYSSKTAGIKLDGNTIGSTPRIKSLYNLNPGAILENQVLGKLDFNGNKSADFEFKITCEEGFTITQSHTFYDEDIDLYIDKLVYDQANGLIIYNVKNKGTRKTTNKVKLKYSNVSEDDNLDGQTALLENSLSATIDLGEIPGNNGETGDRKLAIDFKYADESSFKFELIYNDNIITHETKVKNFKAKPVQLSIVPLTPLRLMGSQQEIKCKIELGADSRPLDHIDTSKLSLSITNLSRNSAYLALTSGKESIDKLAGEDLGALGNEVTLHINSNGSRGAQFNFDIEYKGKSLTTNPLSISWEEATLEIIELNDFINNDIATFKLKNLNPLDSIDTESIHIELLSSNNAEFTLLDAGNTTIGKTPNLHQLVAHLNLLQPAKATEPISFQLANTNGEKEATITLIVKRGTNELARKDVLWKKEENLIKLNFEKLSFTNEEVIGITLLNAGPTLDANTTRIQLTNDKNIQFKLNGSIENRIDTTLKEFIDEDNFIKGETTKISLQIAHVGNEYSATFTLKILDNNNEIIGGNELTWTNFQKLIDTEEDLDRIETIIVEIRTIQEHIETLEKGKQLNLKIWEENAEKIIDKQLELRNTLENRFENIGSIDNPSRDTQTEKLRNIQESNKDIEEYILNSLNYASANVEYFAQKIKDIKEGSKTNGLMGVVSLNADRTSIKAWAMTLLKLEDKFGVSTNTETITQKAIKAYESIKEVMDTPIKVNRESNETNTNISQIELDKIFASPKIETPRRMQKFFHKKNNSNENPKARRKLGI
ncbi:hypothetical protein [Candidatus Amoebophilus asiaticus]|nr:hypothetical protein [Candidatus Amoebophilus asiaticus]